MHGAALAENTGTNAEVLRLPLADSLPLRMTEVSAFCLATHPALAYAHGVIHLLWPLLAATGLLERAVEGWHRARMWTLMYRGGLLAGAVSLVVFIVSLVLAAQRERARLEALVASRTRQLRQSEELFRSIFEHATEGIFQSSLDGRNLRANPAMARLCGYTSPEEMREELTDTATLFYVQPGRREEINAEVVLRGVVQDCESEIYRKGGGTIWVAESVGTVIDPATGDTVYQGSIVDITARRETQLAHEQARAAAEAANRAKSAFLAHMTHELRTPLTGILGGARVALQDPATDEKNRHRYALIADSGEHLLRLIDEALDHSRIEAGRLELRARPFDLAEFLRAVSGRFGPQAADARLGFRCEAEPALPQFVHGDALRLRQVLDNLLYNALKFTDHGEVALGIRRESGARVGFEVRDTGIGIPAETLATIFRPFQQVPAPGRPGTPGVGLGLSISARLVGLLGGELRVESAPARGSRFFFDIPLPDADHGETLQNAKLKEPDPSSPPTRLVMPSVEEIDALTALSLAGDIVRLRQRATKLARANPEVGNFARELERLAAGFRMDAIGQFLRDARQHAHS